MGLLLDGEPYTWDMAEKHIAEVKRRGIKQFTNIMNSNRDRSNDLMKWGDEVCSAVFQR